MAKKQTAFQKLRPQNNRKPVNAGLCEYRNCRQVAQMMDDRCGRHSVMFAALAEHVEVAKPSPGEIINRWMGELDRKKNDLRNRLFGGGR